MTTYDNRPQVLTVIPKNLSIDVATTLNKIVIGFNTDLDVNHVKGNIRVEDLAGNYVPTQVAYSQRMVSITFSAALDPGTTYRISIFGDMNVNDNEITGIRNVFGTPMAGVYQSTFTTVSEQTLLPPKVLHPMDGTQVSEKPAFQWENVEGASTYQIRMAKFNTMEPLLWPLPPDSPYLTESAVPNVHMEDGIYYWQIRSISDTGKPSNWSSVMAFNLHTQQEYPVAPEDTLPPVQMPFDEFIMESHDLMEMFPKDGASNQDTKIATIYFRILGTITKEDVELFEVRGESVLGDEEPHDLVDGTWDVYPQEDGSTIIGFTPNPLPAE